MTWIEIVEIGPGSGAKTRRFVVRANAEPQPVLGLIKFHPAWRKFAFFPQEKTLYEEDCLRDIADHCAEQTRLWRESKVAGRATQARKP